MATTTARKSSATLADRLYAVLKTHQKSLNTEWDYAHIAPFTKKEVADFLTGKPGASIGNGYGRSHQVKQAVSAIGAHFASTVHPDAKTNAMQKKYPESVAVHKELWSIRIEAKCTCCNKKYMNKFMFPRPTCDSSRCQLKFMRDNI